jgi:hypothetical protein
VKGSSSYSLAVRLAHFVSIFLLLLLFATGVRLAWLDGDFFSRGTGDLVDTVALTGHIHNLHLICGVILVAVGCFYFVYLLLGGEASRLLLLFLDRRYSFTKKIFYLLALVVGAVSFLSGVTLFNGLYVGSEGYTFMKLLHFYSFVFLVVFTVVHVVDVVISKGMWINEIFFAEPGRGFFNAGAFAAAALPAFGIGVFTYMVLSRPKTLVCKEQNRNIVVDGKAYDIEWLGVDSLVVQTGGGINFAGGSSQVTVKTFHNGQHIYFLLKWTDQTRSFNRHLIKTKDEWVEQASQYIDIFGESIYAEDKVALTFQRDRKGCLATCHVRTPEKMGLHYTDGDTVDVWEWMAVSTNPAGQATDGWWGVWADANMGGRHYDNIASGGYRSNLNEGWMQPYFLPQYGDWRAWIWIDAYDYEPYYEDKDTFSIGARIPAVLVAPATGDRGDVQARGRWYNGVWTVELARRLSTGSSFDAAFRGEWYLGIAPFDNAVSKHAYHLKPIRLVIEQH